MVTFLFQIPNHSPSLLKIGIFRKPYKSAPGQIRIVIREPGVLYLSSSGIPTASVQLNEIDTGTDTPSHRLVSGIIQTSFSGIGISNVSLSLSSTSQTIQPMKTVVLLPPFPLTGPVRLLQANPHINSSGIDQYRIWRSEYARSLLYWQPK